MNRVILMVMLVGLVSLFTLVRYDERKKLITRKDQSFTWLTLIVAFFTAVAGVYYIYTYICGIGQWWLGITTGSLMVAIGIIVCNSFLVRVLLVGFLLKKKVA